MLTTIRTQYARIAATGANLYQRALRTVGITDSLEARVTAAVAVCVAAWYIVCAIAWVADLFSHTEAFTALAQ